jgi:RNA polymerase sigma factor (sigma-70 family)
VAADEINAMIAKLAVANSWRLIRALGIRVDEREDIQQDLHFALWIRVGRFDASRGAPSTFLRRVAENESRKIIANRIAACRDYRRCVGLDDRRVTCQSRNPFRREERLILRLDIGRFIESLPPKLRRVVIALKTCSPTEVAGQLGISRETVYERIHELRTRFETWAPSWMAPVQPAAVLRMTR